MRRSTVLAFPFSKGSLDRLTRPREIDFERKEERDFANLGKSDLHFAKLFSLILPIFIFIINKTCKHIC
jgi:hypothetical protein